MDTRFTLYTFSTNKRFNINIVCLRLNSFLISFFLSLTRLRHDVNDRPRYYSDILSMSSMTSLEQNPSEDEINLVDHVLDFYPPKTPE